MAQALDPQDVDAQQGNGVLAPGSNPPPGDTPASPPSDSSATQQESPILKAAASIKSSTISFSKSATEKSKARLSMEGQLRQARISLERYVNPKILKKQINEDTRIPKWVLKHAKGLVFLSVVKAGFLFAGNVGTGCVIVRQPNGGWTGPSSIGVAGVSFGFLAGASKVDHIMILPDDRAVKQFTGKGQLRLGGELQLAVGPVGREGSGSVGAGDKGVSVIYSYSHCQGLYGGVALDGKVISVRPDCNKAFYKRTVKCDAILNGNVAEVPANDDYDMIVHLLDSYCLEDDLTPIKGEKLSIDDLNDEDDAKQDNMANGVGKGAVEPSLGRRMSDGFNKFASSVSGKFSAMKSDLGGKSEVKLPGQVDKEKQGLKADQQAAGKGKEAQYQIGSYGQDDLVAPAVSSDEDDGK